MGLARPVLEWIAKQHRSEDLCGPVLTLGVQQLGVTNAELADLVGKSGQIVDAAMIDTLAGDTREATSQDFFGLLGATPVESLDRFGGEGATLIADLAQPLPESLVGVFSLVIDGGTLEHVSDIAFAFENTARLVAVGGVVIHVSPISGWENHGFYSLQPQLFRQFYRANGFDEIAAELLHLPRDSGLQEGRIEPCPGTAVPFATDSADEHTLMLFAARKTVAVDRFVLPVDSHQSLSDLQSAAKPRWNLGDPGPVPPKLRDDLLHWREAEEFGDVYRSAAAICGPGPMDRYYTMKELLLSLGNLEADTAEIGVYRGLGSRLLCHYSREMPRRDTHCHHAFDSFLGLSGPEWQDSPSRSDVRPWNDGDMSVSREEFEAALSPYPEVRIYENWIPDCFAAASEESFAFVHVDVDLYAPTRDAITFCYPRLIDGGIMLFDDYGFMTCPGARRAIDEFIEGASERLVRLPTGQAYLVRRRT